MAEKTKVLCANCRRYIDALEAGGTDPMVIAVLRSLVRQNTSIAETASRLWRDNQALQAEIVKKQATIESLKK